MADQPVTEPPINSFHCPWCSAELPSGTAEQCPSCGATLVGETEAPLPGITAIDAEAVIRGARIATPQRRSRLLSWISGADDEPDESPAPPGSLAPPPPEVRREMLRLELAAEVANLQAEAESIVSESQVEAQEDGTLPADTVDADAVADRAAAGVEEGAADEAATEGPKPAA